MAVVGRLWALIMVLCGAALLFAQDVFPGWLTEFIASFIDVGLFGAVVALSGSSLLAYLLMFSTPDRHPRRPPPPIYENCCRHTESYSDESAVRGN